jgi:sigma-E factor negative regulatory protein RseC
MPSRITKAGVVKAIRGPMAVAVTQRESECEGCKARGSCEAMGGTGANAEVTAINTANAKVGDPVTIGLRGTSLVKASFVIYMTPLLGLVGGMFLGFLLAGVLPMNKEVVVGSLAGAGLLAALVWMKRKAAQMAASEAFTPEIVAIRRDVPKEERSCPAGDAR